MSAEVDPSKHNDWCHLVAHLGCCGYGFGCDCEVGPLHAEIARLNAEVENWIDICHSYIVNGVHSFG